MTDDEQAQAVLNALAWRKWVFADPDGVHIMTDRDILAHYYPYWSEMMYRALRQDDIDEEACIQDFVMGHWAKELK